MKIDYIKINGFGKVKDRELEFKDGINVVYGENESGKSTMLKFIPSMLYGVAKTKNGKKISDYDKLLPWDGSEFSGKIKYTLKNKEQYEIYRDFKKKKPIVYNDLGEDITKNYGTMSSKESNFFEEQVGIDENTFFNTAIVEQQAVKLDKANTNVIVQKISNLISTGDDNISFKKSLEKINKLQNENIGTDRTKNKPINIVNENINHLEIEKRNLMLFKENINENKTEKQNILSKIDECNNKKLFIKDLKKIIDQNKIENAELVFEKNLAQEYFNKLEIIKEKINVEKEKNDNNSANSKSKVLIILSALLIIISIVMFAVVKNVVFGSISIIMAVISFCLMILQNKKNSNKIKNANQELATKYDIALKNYNKKKQDVEEKMKKINNNLKNSKNDIFNKYKKCIDHKYLERKLNIDESQIESELEILEMSMNQFNIDMHVIDTQKNDIDEKLEKLAKIESKLVEQNEIKSELESLDVSYNLAKECLENAYEEIKHNISPKFEQKLCEITANLTDQKYKKVFVNDDEGIKVESENGLILPVDKLSIGTIDEMYLALRLSTLEEISDENLPIMLDETFAYFDNRRLKNILYYLQDQNYDNQIIIFTCSNREEQILNELKIEYNLINLEK